MNIKIVLSIGVALLTGAAIALQASLNGRAGAIIGPIRTGLLVNALGGSIAATALLLFFLTSRMGVNTESVELGGIQTVGITAAAGLLGILIIIGVSFSVQGIGITAGLSAVILAQLVMGLIIDASGAAGAEIVALDLRRFAGVLVMAIGVYLLVPKA